MSRRSKPRKTDARQQSSSAERQRSARRSRPLLWGAVVVLMVIGAAAAWLQFRGRVSPHRSEQYQPRPPGTLTFSKDVAPILLANCATCHRPGQTAPYPLIHYADVKKHARDIADVTKTRYMPPWLPEPGYGEFIGERRLTIEQIGIIQQWVAEGSLEGDPKDLPAEPKWREGWQLGEPDLVVALPKPFHLPGEGKDIYRNFVIPIPLAERRYVKAVEFNPGSRSVHHAFFLFDRSHRARRLQKSDEEPGFPGMSLPEGASSPPGHFLSWQPGKVPGLAEDMAWTLERDTDLVLQAHMQPTGKSESVQPSLAFYFTGAPSSRTLVKLGLSNLAIDIPPNVQSHVIEDTFQLPVDAEVLALLPHTHYLGKELQGFASLPDGSKKWLLLIKNWDFNWQNEYRLKQPVFLPRGSTLTMRYSFDNSTNNIRNPNHPPKRVQYGLQTTDEMAELWVQLQLGSKSDLPRVEKSLFASVVRKNMAFYEYRLRINPADAEAHTRLGEAFLSTGNKTEAFPHLNAAVQLDPEDDRPHYHLGLLFRTQNQLDNAIREFQTALRLNPENSKAHGNLGFIFVSQGDMDQAELHLKRALELNPNDTVASNTLAQILATKARR